MLRNLQRLRAQYHQQAQERAQTAKSRAPEGGDPRNVDNTVDRMEEDDVGLTDESRVKKNPSALDCFKVLQSGSALECLGLLRSGSAS